MNIIMPNTGSVLSIVLMIAGGIVVVGGLIFLVVWKKKHKDEPGEED